METTIEILTCSECGRTSEEATVHRHDRYWSAWGRNAFELNWKLNDDAPIDTCESCESDLFKVCSNCGADVCEDGIVAETRCPSCDTPFYPDFA